MTIMRRTAVVLLEMQNDFVSPGGKLFPLLSPVLELNNTIENVKKLLTTARSADMLVVHVPIQFSKDYREMGGEPYGILRTIKDSGALISKSWGAEIAPSIDVHDEDIIIEGKSSIDAFSGTNLNAVLRANKVDRIVLGGMLTNVCIESTIRAAYDLGYTVVGIADATATTGIKEYSASVSYNWPLFAHVMCLAEFGDYLSVAAA